MKKMMLMAAVMLSSVGAFAQHAVGTTTLQPRLGINIANVTDLDNTKSRVDFAGGLEVEHQVTDLFSVSAGLMYSRQGVKEKDVNASLFGYNVRVEGDSWTPSYLNVPIMANVYVVKGLAVKLGIQPGFVVEKDDMDNMKTFDFSIPVGLSYEYSNVVLDARYNWGLTKMLDKLDCKNSVFQITLGYKFEL